MVLGLRVQSLLEATFWLKLLCSNTILADLTELPTWSVSYVNAKLYFYLGNGSNVETAVWQNTNLFCKTFIFKMACFMFSVSFLVCKLIFSSAMSLCSSSKRSANFYQKLQSLMLLLDFSALKSSKRKQWNTESWSFNVSFDFHRKEFPVKIVQNVMCMVFVIKYVLESGFIRRVIAWMNMSIFPKWLMYVEHE